MAERLERTLTIQVRGSREDAGDVRLEDFIDELDSVKNALRETERAVTGHDPSLYFRIVAMSHDSPATIVLEADSDLSTEATQRVASVVMRQLTTNLRFLGRKKRAPRTADVPVLESYREMTVPLSKHIAEVTIRAGKHTAIINNTFKETLDRILGPEEVVHGSISGMIEAINIHNTSKFYLYPTVGPRKILGRFGRTLRHAFIGSVGKYVTVYGQLRYKTWDKFPYAITADDIEIHDEEQSGTLGDIKGMAPGLTGDLTTDEFLEKIRNENW